MRDFRLAIPAAIGWIAAAVLIGLPAAAGWAAIAAAVVAVVLLLVRAPGILALVCIAIALLSAVIATRAPERESLDPARLTTVSVVVTGDGEGLVGSAPVMLFGDVDAPIGATVSVRGTAVATDPGDHAAYLFFVESSSVTAAPPWFIDWANGLRGEFAAAATKLPGDGAALLPGLAIGDTSAVSEELDDAMKASSLSHLTAVSGANCAVVVGLVMLLGKELGVRRSARIGASLGVLLAFVVLVTPEPSVLRAAVMATIVLAALATGRPVRGVPVLGLAILVLLVADPWLARDYGFVLSVLATGGLLLLSGPLALLFRRWLPPWAALVIAVPLAAQLCCQPVLLLLQPTLPTWGVVANVLAEPAAPVATVLGLAACVVLPFVPWLGNGLAALAWLPASWIAAVATFFAEAPLAALPWPGGIPGVILLTALTVIGLVAAFRRSRLAILALAAGLTLVVGIGAGSRFWTLIDRPADWQVAMCDVGQGDASLVRSHGQIALIDTGPDPKLLDACLADLGIVHLDLLVLTHFDLDHVGGLRAVLGRVDRVLVGPSGGPDDDRLVAQLAAGGATVERAAKGSRGELGDLQWSVLWPREPLGTTEPGNDASVTLVFEGDLDSLFLGDLGELPQARLMAVSPIPEVDVVKVAHHGSADQSARTYERAHAVVGLIGVGADNDYGHPTDSLLDTLDEVGTTAFRTDLDGLILVSMGDDGVEVWTARSRDGPSR